MKTIGLIGGMSWESTAVYYQLLNRYVQQALGGLHSAQLVMWSFDFAEIEELQACGDWQTAAGRMIAAARRIKKGGAECVVLCTNTMHKLADEVQNAVDIPLIHIVDATAKAIAETSAEKPLLLATRYTMEQGFYKGRLSARHDIDVCVPGEEDRQVVHDIIYNELCRGVISDASKQKYLAIVQRARADGADSAIFGCTEVGLLLSQRDFDIPIFNSTAIHARAAVEFALDGT
ncbi:MAG: aspartate/glutamate racemase family protein [Proteobacteria bacterium]|nr:aspartate/glutamate racemase family protein [Pseudomonadota bacterium]